MCGIAYLAAKDLGHQVDVDALLQLLGGCVDTAVDGDAGVRDEQVNASEGGDESCDVLFRVRKP
jgi:hypothetical protein